MSDGRQDSFPKEKEHTKGVPGRAGSKEKRTYLQYAAEGSGLLDYRLIADVMNELDVPMCPMTARNTLTRIYDRIIENSDLETYEEVEALLMALKADGRLDVWGDDEE